MPRLVHSHPKYSRHKASGRAVVTIDGADYYLGAYGSRESRVAYDRLIAEWISNGRQLRSRDEMTVGELMLAYWRFCQGYYRTPNGQPSGQLSPIKLALRPLKKLYVHTPVEEFGPLALKAVRDEMIRMGWCRTHINGAVGKIKRLFRWGVENELCPASVYQSLAAVTGLKQGRTEARESEPVTAVPESLITPVLAHVSPQVAAMIKLQLLTGMRPGEVTSMRTCDIYQYGPLVQRRDGMAIQLWQYKPQHHKTQHHGQERVVTLGAAAQELLRPFLKPDLQAYVFSPSDAEAQRRQSCHAVRRTPMSCGNSPGSNRVGKGRRSPGSRYTKDSYRQAIVRACEAAFQMPESIRQPRTVGAKAADTAEFKAARAKARREWRAVHVWSPNQVRHTAATKLRAEFGLEAAQVILGHKTLTVTQVYAEKNLEAATRIMGEVG